MELDSKKSVSDASCLNPYFITFLLEGGTCLGEIVAILACVGLWQRIHVLPFGCLSAQRGLILAGLGVLAVGLVLCAHSKTRERSRTNADYK